MIMTVGLTVLTIDRDQKSEGQATMKRTVTHKNAILLNLNVYETACLGGGLRSPSVSHFTKLIVIIIFVY